MVHPTRLGRAATYDDVCQVPDHLVAEILDGELWKTPRPSLPHAHVSSMLGIEIGAPFGQGRGGPGGWWILDEPELHVGPDIVVPDIAGWHRERMAGIPNAAFLTLVPDWVCEVVSPSTERIDRQRKLRIYGREGVRDVWLVNPLLRTLEVLRLENARWTLVTTLGGDEEARVEPFDAVTIPLSRIWPEMT
jgi:Uma2 family endonuclease